MKKSDFRAHMALLLSRYPVEDTARAAWQAQVERVWSHVRRWDGEDADRFFAAIEGLAASDRYGRPTVDQILEACREHKAIDPDADRDLRRYDALRHYLTSGYLTLHSGRLRVAGAIGCAPAEVDAYWEALLVLRQCPRCQFGIALIAGEARETDSPSGCTWDVEMVGDKVRHNTYVRGWTYYRCLHCGGVRREKGQPTGASVAFDAPDETEADMLHAQQATDRRRKLGPSFRKMMEKIEGHTTFDGDVGFPDDPDPRLTKPVHDEGDE